MTRTAWTIPWILLALLAVAAQGFPEATSALQFDRAGVWAGQPWRLLTCHWTHWSGDHLLWSGGAFVVLGLASLRVAPGWGLACVGVAAVVVGGVVWLGTDLSRYRGLSGIDS